MNSDKHNYKDDLKSRFNAYKASINKVSIGSAGEYFVAAELERRGFTVALPMSNTKDFDILAVSRNGSNKQYAIQVKTTIKTKSEWILSKKNENLVGNNIFYVFVSMYYVGDPCFHIVPSKAVAEQIKKNHDEWLTKLDRNNKPHKDNNMRKFEDEANVYLGKWSLLD